MELRHLGGEALHHRGLAPPVLVDGVHHEPQVAPGVKASDEEHGLDVADVGEHDLRDYINNLQHEDLVQYLETQLVNHAQATSFMAQVQFFSLTT